MYRASCLRRTRFSARIALDERKTKTHSLRMSETIPTIVPANCSMRSSCQSRPAFAGVGHRNARDANYCGPHPRLLSKLAALGVSKDDAPSAEADAAITIAGIEPAHRIHKKQFSFGQGRPHSGRSLRTDWQRALA